MSFSRRPNKVNTQTDYPSNALYLLVFPNLAPIMEQGGALPELNFITIGKRWRAQVTRHFLLRNINSFTSALSLIATGEHAVIFFRSFLIAVGINA